MKSETKNKSLVSIIVFLLITNVAMLFFFIVLNKPAQKTSHEKAPIGMSNLLQKDVGFSKGQLDNYLSLRKQQLDKVHPLFDDLRKAKMDFYTLIYTPQISDSAITNAAEAIAQKQKTLDLQMFNHFKTVRAICTPDQLQKFDTTIKKVLIRMTGRTGKDRHN